MPFIAPAIAAVAAAVGIGATAASVIGAVGAVAVGVGVSYLSNKLFGAKAADPETSSSAGAPTGVQTSVQLGGAVPRSCIYGRQATAGHWDYWNVHGASNEYLQLVYLLGDGEHDALEVLYIDGEPVTLGDDTGAGRPVTTTKWCNGDQARIFVRFFRGTETQAADEHLVTYGNPSGRWTTDDRLAGICYVSITLFYDETVFGGIPRWLFQVRGRTLYDPRKDSTAGGSGLHRWTDKTTWEWSDNPAICLYNHQRGLWLGGELILGQGLAPLDLVTDMYVAAANACDELVDLAEGGTEKRYRLGMQVSADTEHRDAIERMVTAMAGLLIERAGAFGPLAGVAQVPVLSFTDEDLIAGAPAKYSAKRSRAELVNAVFATFSDPDQTWESVAVSPRTSSADELTDGERLAVPRDYPMIWSQAQAQRVAEIERRLARRQAAASVTLGLAWIVVEPGDWITWTSARFGFDTTFRVDATQPNDDHTVTLSLREIADDVFDWSTEDELDPQVPGDLPGYATPALTVSGFGLADVTITGAGGLKVPALRATWSPTSDRTITAVLIEYRPQAQPTAVKQIRCDAPSGGEQIIAEAIQAATVYEARATIETVPARTTAWTSWVEETAPAEHVVPTALTALTTLEQLSETVTATFAALLAKVDEWDEIIAAAALSRAQGEWLDKKKVRTEIAATGGKALAAVTELSTVVVTNQQAFAAYQVTVAATFEGVTASVETNTAAIATVDGKLLATAQLRLNANGYVSGFKAYNDGVTSTFIVQADTFAVAWGGLAGGTPVPVFAIQNVNGSAKLSLRGDMLADGTITAGKLLVSNLSAITANVGTCTAGLLRSSNNLFRVELDNARILISDG